MPTTRAQTMVAGVLLLLAAGARAAAPGEADLALLVERKVAAVERLHHKIERTLVAVAQEPVFVELLLHRDGDSHDEEQHRARARELMLASHNGIDIAESCLIGVDGAERVRIVDNVVDDRHAADESSAPFFTAGLNTPHRQAFVSAPYLSPDAGDWVVGYATPVVADGAVLGLLHYEVRMEVYRAMFLERAGPTRVRMLVLDQHGSLLADTAGEPLMGAGVDAVAQRLDGVGMPSVRSAVAERLPLLGADGRHRAVAMSVSRGWEIIAIGPPR